jgi:hypothetical protein
MGEIMAVAPWKASIVDQGGDHGAGGGGGAVAEAEAATSGAAADADGAAARTAGVSVAGVLAAGGGVGGVCEPPHPAIATKLANRTSRRIIPRA